MLLVLLVVLLVQQQCDSQCEDESWSKRGSPSKDCAWASEHGPRCDAIGGDGKFAYDVCCGCSKQPTSAPTAFCVDEEWDGDCAWVSEFPSSRCEEKDSFGKFAFEVCCDCPPAVLAFTATIVFATRETTFPVEIFRFALDDLISASTSPDNITIVSKSSTTASFETRVSTKEAPQLVADSITRDVSNTTQLNLRLVYWSSHFGTSTVPKVVASSNQTSTWVFVDSSTHVPTSHPAVSRPSKNKRRRRTVGIVFSLAICAVLLCCCIVGTILTKAVAIRKHRLLVDDGIVVVSTQTNPATRGKTTSSDKNHAEEERDDDFEPLELDDDAPNLVIDCQDETMQHVFYGRAEYENPVDNDPPLIEETRIKTQHLPCIAGSLSLQQEDSSSSSARRGDIV